MRAPSVPAFFGFSCRPHFIFRTVAPPSSPASSLYHCHLKPFSCHSPSDPRTVVAAAYCSSSMPNIKHQSYAMPTKTRGSGTATPCCRLAVTLVLGHLRHHQLDAQAPSATTRLRLTPSRAPRSSRPSRYIEPSLSASIS
ncbi:hypothetical protein SEVIR_8G263200v4 [Setaria viridis]|uniref:Uncharacterized protein n=1 Tax=Setaria viridis TaxID=4556 RepID=A0A4U6TK15_SETVI|nr:hypothetical protein SEVIR_8G263200v2 [Setaria viridis]